MSIYFISSTPLNKLLFYILQVDVVFDPKYQTKQNLNAVSQALKYRLTLIYKQKSSSLYDNSHPQKPNPQKSHLHNQLKLNHLFQYLIPTHA